MKVPLEAVNFTSKTVSATTESGPRATSDSRAPQWARRYDPDPDLWMAVAAARVKGLVVFICFLAGASATGWLVRGVLDSVAGMHFHIAGF